MNRRAFFLGASAFAASATAKAAVQQLGPPTPMGVPMRAFVAQPAVIRQQCPEWCWAASSAMIFTSHGFPIDQRAIVARVFGGVACAPAFTTGTIGAVLSSRWVDAGGRPFQAQVTAAYDAENGINAINNNFIANELAQNRPLLYGNTHHAMVVVDVDFYNTPMGPNVQRVGVIDPWPASPAYHPLSPPEMVPAHMGGQMMFLASVMVS